MEVFQFSGKVPKSPTDSSDMRFYDYDWANWTKYYILKCEIYLSQKELYFDEIDEEFIKMYDNYGFESIMLDEQS